MKMKEEDKIQPVFAAFGNPLLDIIVSDEEGDIVETFGLQKDWASSAK